MNTKKLKATLQGGGVKLLTITFLMSFNLMAQQQQTSAPPIICGGAIPVFPPGSSEPEDPFDPTPPVTYSGATADSVVCSPSGEDYLEDYRWIEHYKNYDNQAIKTVQIALHVFRDDFGNFVDNRIDSIAADDTLVWQDNAATQTYVQNFEGWINQKYTHLVPSSETYTDSIFYSDSKIRVKVMAVYFYNNTSLYLGNIPLYKYIDSLYPERLKYLPILIPKNFGVGYAPTPTFQSDTYPQAVTSGISPSYFAAGHIAHELGHNLDLEHLYKYNKEGNYVGAPEPIDTNDLDWVDDIFNYGDTWCLGSNPDTNSLEYIFQVCYDDFEDCDPYANDSLNHCTNNFMAATTVSCEDYPNVCFYNYFSPSQIAKMHRACHIKSIRRYVWGYSSKPYLITKDETWDFSIKFYQDIVVKSGTTLTIQCDVQMVPQAKIIVEKGAKLIIDGGRIRNALNSDDFWQGIQIYGDASKPQTPQYQGMVIMRNGGSIEGALNAIRVWKVDNWATMGGIVKAYDAHFINNRRAVEFMPYSRIINGTEYPNQSAFYDCTFYWDDDLMSAHPANAHITLYKVEGVKFVSCDFEDRRTNLTLENGGSGIFSIDAKYKVLPQATALVPTGSPQDTYFDSSNYDVSTFKRLRAGVHATSAASQNTITVDHAKFIDCYNGIILSQVDNAMLTRNKFKFTGVDYAWMETSQVDIAIDRSSAYQVEGNVFSATTSPVASAFNTTGVSVRHTGSSANRIYKNKSQEMNFGMHAYGQNRANANINLATGLQFLCNEYNSNNIFDEYIQKDYNQTINGIRYLQGELAFTPPTFQYYSAGNVFFTGSVLKNIKNLNFTPMKYVYYLSNPDEEPTKIEGNVTKQYADNQNLCPSSFTSISVGVPGPVSPVLHAQLVTDFTSTNTALQLKQTALHGLLALGNNPALHTMVACVNPFTKYLVQALLTGSSPYLSESLLKEVADKSPFYFSSNFLKDLVIANIEVAQNTNLLNYLTEKSVPMSEAKIAEIKAQFGNFTLRGKQELDLLRLKTEKTRIANTLLKGLLQDTVGTDKAAFQEWILKRGDELAGFQLADDLLERGEKAACSAILDSLSTVADNLPKGMLKKELVEYVSFKRQLLTLTDDRGILTEWNKNAEKIIKTYLKGGIASYADLQAQNLLCYFTGSCKYYRVEMGDGSKSLYQNPSIKTDENKQQTTAKTFSQQFTLYPNPTENNVRIHINGFEYKAIVFMTDLSGRIVLQQINTQNNEFLDLSELGAGMYNVRVIADGKHLGTQKLIIK